KGLFITADGQEKALGEVLEMAPAIALVKGAIQQVTEWREITGNHRNLQPDVQGLQDYSEAAEGLQKSAMLLSAPDGVGIVSPQTVMLQGNKALYAQSHGEVHVAASKRMALNASHAISLLAQTEGVRLVSGKGPFELESHADTLSVTALKDITVQTTQGHLQLTAKNGITLACGGAYIRLTPDGQIEVHGPDLISLKGRHVLDGPVSQDFPLPDLPRSSNQLNNDLPQKICKECLLRAQDSAAGFIPR
ncbi:DUF2345 domain-containing protein, partial [Intestinirhabdus alba]